MKNNQSGLPFVFVYVFSPLHMFYALFNFFPQNMPGVLHRSIVAARNGRRKFIGTLHHYMIGEGRNLRVCDRFEQNGLAGSKGFMPGFNDLSRRIYPYALKSE